MLNFTSLANVCLSVAELLSPPNVIPRPTNASNAFLDATSFKVTVSFNVPFASCTVRLISPALSTVYAWSAVSGFGTNR